MKLSIIIPYYNADRWIGMMLDSLLEQDLLAEEYEIIVVDDGSKDEPEVLKEYAASYANIRYIRQENSGPGGARNTGIKAAQGDYLFFCDSDDFIAKNILGTLYDTAHSHNADMLFHQIREVQENECIESFKIVINDIKVYKSGKEYLSHLYGKKIRTGPCHYIIKRSFVEKAQLLFPDLIVTEDSCFFVDAIMNAHIVASIDNEIYYYVQHPKSLLHYEGRVQKTEKYADNMMVFLTKLANILCDSSNFANSPVTFMKSIEWIRNRKAFIMLLVTCRYLPHNKFCYYLERLQSIGSFPKPEGRHILIKRLVLNPFCIKLINRYYNFRYNRNIV